MIEDFIQSWDLFAHTYIVGGLIAVLLAMVGVVVVARDQVFLGAAVAQASTLGIALAIALGGALGGEWAAWLESETTTAVAAVSFAVLASLFAGWRGRPGGGSHEAVTGWVFLVSSALAVLVVAHSPHGLAEVQRLLASTIIGATTADVWLFSALTGVSAATLLAAYRVILLLVMDPETAAALGVRVNAWGFALAAWLGLCLGLSLRAAGLLYAFGCLILPALIAANLCRRVRPMFIVAPFLAFLAALCGFILANHYDLPPAQATVALLGLALLPAWMLRRG